MFQIIEIITGFINIVWTWWKRLYIEDTSSDDERSLASSDNIVGTSCDDDRPERDDPADNNRSVDDGDESKTNGLMDGLRLREQTVTTDTIKSPSTIGNSDADVHLNDESTAEPENVENIFKKSVHNLDMTEWSALYTEAKKFIVEKYENIN